MTEVFIRLCLWALAMLARPVIRMCRRHNTSKASALCLRGFIESQHQETIQSLDRRFARLIQSLERGWGAGRASSSMGTTVPQPRKTRRRAVSSSDQPSGVKSPPVSSTLSAEPLTSQPVEDTSMQAEARSLAI